MLHDPVFGGLAISLVFGTIVATLLTLLVIPVLLYLFLKDKADSPQAIINLLEGE